MPLPAVYILKKEVSEESKMKKVLAIVLVALLLISMSACAAKTDSDAKTDLEHIKEKGTLVVGITDFNPMDYRAADGSWIGFDADMATAFAKSLGVDVEFVEIEWDNKIFELDGKTIDCVWNGMTLTDEVMSAMDCSNAYCNNTQVVILSADVADGYPSIESMKNLVFAVEAGSSGEKEAAKLSLETVPVKDQATAIMEVAAHTCDAAVVDALMAGAMVGEGTGYSDLTYTISLNEKEGEQYGVGFRKGSDLVEVFNEFMKTAYADGTMIKIAEQYGVQASIIPQ